MGRKSIKVRTSFLLNWQIRNEQKGEEIEMKKATKILILAIIVGAILHGSTYQINYISFNGDYLKTMSRIH